MRLIRGCLVDYSGLVARFDEIVSKEKHATGESRNSFKRMLFRIWSSNQRSDKIRGQETTISRDDIAKSAEVFPTYVSRKIKVLIDAGLITSGEKLGKHNQAVSILYT